MTAKCSECPFMSVPPRFKFGEIHTL
uniref:Uncharacterized protein n=1 Tax=Anguilla anguilla TaxID=7936 RepID=A0A0E9V8K9_ANGAN